MSTLNDFLFWASSPHYIRKSFDSLIWYCGNEEVLGVDEVEEWQDWSDRQTTADQRRIEDVLKTLDLRDKRILHVGVGNSQLATDFQTSVDAIVGITIQRSEFNRARDLEIPGYTVFLLNKYSAILTAKLNKRYDLIIDNNPSAFACCRKHFFTMMKNYTELLNPGGMIVTDRHGLAWSTLPNDSRWKLMPEEWFKIGKHYKLEGKALSETVLALYKPTRLQ